MTLHFCTSRVPFRALSNRRHYASTPPSEKTVNYTTTHLTPDFRLRTCQAAFSPFPRDTRPLVVIFGFLGAKQRWMERYGDLYTQRGYDVLTVKARLNVLWPPAIPPYTAQLLDCLKAQKLTSRPIVVHSMSAGVTYYTNMLEDALGNFAVLNKQVVGQIHDSIVMGETIPRNAAIGVADTLPLPQVITTAFKLTKKYTTDNFNQIARVARTRHNPSLPILVFCSENDRISESRSVLKMVEVWRKQGIQVEVKGWKKSRHCAHLHLHRDDYVSTLNRFLDSLPLGTT